MTLFLRVHDDRTGHEYDTPVDSLEAGPHPHLTVIDKVPVEEQRPAKHGVNARGELKRAGVDEADLDSAVDAVRKLTK